jgi:hypothetical protein
MVSASLTAFAIVRRSILPHLSMKIMAIAGGALSSLFCMYAASKVRKKAQRTEKAFGLNSGGQPLTIETLRKDRTKLFGNLGSFELPVYPNFILPEERKAIFQAKSDAWQAAFDQLWPIDIQPTEKSLKVKDAAEFLFTKPTPVSPEVLQFFEETHTNADAFASIKGEYSDLSDKQDLKALTALVDRAVLLFERT